MSLAYIEYPAFFVGYHFFFFVLYGLLFFTIIIMSLSSTFVIFCVAKCLHPCLVRGAIRIFLDYLIDILLVICMVTSSYRRVDYVQ